MRDNPSTTANVSKRWIAVASTPTRQHCPLELRLLRLTAQLTLRDCVPTHPSLHHNSPKNEGG